MYIAKYMTCPKELAFVAHPPPEMKKTNGSVIQKDVAVGVST